MPTFEQQRREVLRVAARRASALREGGPGSGRRPKNGLIAHLVWKPEAPKPDLRGEKEKLVDRYKRLKGRANKINLAVDFGASSKTDPWDASYGRRAQRVAKKIKVKMYRTAVTFKKKYGSYPWEPVRAEGKSKFCRRVKTGFGKSPFRPNLAEKKNGHE